MTTVKILIRGTSPLLMDAMSKETLQGLITGNRAPIVKDRPLEETAATKIYREDIDKSDSPIGLPSRMLYSSLNAAGRSVKNGKKALATAKSSTLPAFLTIKNHFFRFKVPDGKPETPWKVNVALGRLPKDGTAVGLVRPEFPEWEFEVDIEFNDKMVNEKVLRQLFDEAGRSQGLGAFRPNCKGTFGKFEVADWKSTKIDTDAAGKTEVVSATSHGRNGNGVPATGETPLSISATA